jgi:hypothetical protein
LKDTAEAEERTFHIRRRLADDLKANGDIGDYGAYRDAGDVVEDEGAIAVAITSGAGVEESRTTKVIFWSNLKQRRVRYRLQGEDIGSDTQKTCKTKADCENTAEFHYV